MDSVTKCFGGKHYLAAKFYKYFPKEYDCYVEPFCGSAAMLFHKAPDNQREVINDLNGKLIAFMETLRDHPESLCDYLRLTPFSQITFDGAKNAGEEVPLKNAVNYFIRNRMSRDALGQSMAPVTKRLRSGHDEHANAFRSAIERIPDAALRLQYVRIEQMDGIECIKKYDEVSTFHFIDPPYQPSTRVAGRHEVEMTHDEHMRLLLTLGDIRGKFMLCCYPSHEYAKAADDHDWHHVDFDQTARMSTKDPQTKRVERIYTNYDPHEGDGDG